MLLCHALTVIAAASLMTSCSPVLYSTVGQNVPLFHKKGEVAMSGARGETGHASGFSGNLAVAVSDHAAIISSWHSLHSWGTSGGGTYFELGAGKYKHYPSTVVTELFGGIGLGSISNSINGESIGVSYIKPFVQPSVGISGKVCELAFTPRIALVSYTSKTGYSSDAAIRTRVDDFYQTKKNTVVFEPGITFRIGYKNVKLQLQYNYTTLSYNKDSVDSIDETFTSIGLHFNITDWWATKKK